MNYIKSPFNYIGGKYKLLKYIIPYFPQNIDTFVDVFGGGFNVGANINAQQIIYNDQLTPLVDLLRFFNTHSSKAIIQYIENTISYYKLDKTNKTTFKYFREHYNNSLNKCPLDLYVLICYSFNYQIRYNNQGDYNSSHGTNRSSFNKNIKQNLLLFINRLHKLNVTYYNKDFTELPYCEYGNNDFIYFDPPYFISTANYNDGNRGYKNWTIVQENELYSLLDQLNSDNKNWGLSNMIVNNYNITNTLLEDWIETNNYKVYEINSDYGNSNYQKKSSHNNKEVYITNTKVKREYKQTKLL